ncbi:PASTA domain-containing protein [Catenulispora rubra]|uniref:PASTA domain-containing protein n=1 Tax=Catenulispora rubra TaxID=280293 RepID=UPI0018928821|nr:PASTA domain-containing protein [Catenulispora rubra]
MTAWFSRKRAVRTGTYGIGVAGAVGLAVFLGSGHGYPVQSVHQLSGSAWLASSQAGQLTLLDGASAEVAAQVQAAPAGHVLDVVQQGSTAYAIDETAGTLRRVDGATFAPGAPATPIADAASALTAFADSRHVYALDTQRGLLVTVDPHTLAATGTQQGLSAQLAAGTATLDDAGRLWLVDDATGDLTRAADGTIEVRRGVAAPGKDLMALVNGKPVVVDTAGRRAVSVDPADGSPTGTLDLDLRPSDTVAVSGAPHANRLYVVASRGVLEICDLSAHSCSDTVPLDSGGNDLGAAVESGDRVFVPDYTTGQVWVIDLGQHTVVATAQVLTPAAKFQLLTRDGIVFFNDPNSERAGVISLDGAVTQVAKYDPADPTKGLPGHQPSSPSAPPVSQQTKPTSAPPSKTPPSKTPPSKTPPSQPTPSTPPPGGGSSPPPSTPQPTGPSTPPILASSTPSLPSTPSSAAKSTTASAPSSTPTTTPSPTKPAATLTITLSNPNLKFGETENLAVAAGDGTAITSAHWTYGDNQSGDGAAVSHAWARPANATQQTFQVTVAAVLADGRKAQTGMSLTVNHPDTATVPNVVSEDETTAQQQIAGAGLTSSITPVINNFVPVGQVMAQTPVGGGTVAWGSSVALTVSSGPAALWDMVSHACDSAHWSSGAGPLPCPGGGGDATGFAMIHAGSDCYYFTSGQGFCNFLETHPQWVPNGFIYGVYTLPRPVIAGDHFRATLGFMAPKSGSPGKASVTFRLVGPNGQQLGAWDLKAADAKTIDADVDLSTVAAGVTQLTLRVDAHGDVGQCWASWAAMTFGP